MDRTLRFRQLLASRLVQIAGAAAFAAPAAIAACGGSVVVDPPAGEGGSGSGGSGGVFNTSVTTVAPDTSVTSFVTTTVGPSTSVSTGPMTSTGTGQQPVVDCFPWAADSPCPAASDALPYFNQLVDCQDPDWVWTYQVLDGPIVDDSGQCCYTVLQDYCGVGRPFLVEGRPRAATARPGSDPAEPGGWSAGGAAPRLDGLGPAEREALAAAWARDGMLEHASVAAFARFSLELLAAGAPADLVEAAHRAALDEVRHARLCLSLAAEYAGAPVEPGLLPCGDAIHLAGGLPALAAAAAREGCVGETVAAILAAEQLARAKDPAVRRVLLVIAEDEARHAELSFRAVAWALRVGGEAVRAAVAEAFAEAEQGGVAAGGVEADPRGLLAAHGRLDAASARAAAARALREVVLPSARALLAEGGAGAA